MPPKELQLPAMKPCTKRDAPALPRAWYAIALLTPFNDDAPAVAEVVCDTRDSDNRKMAVNCYGLQGGAVRYEILNNGQYYFFPNWPSKEKEGPYQNPRWSVPGPDWVSSQGMTCRGIHSVLGVDAEWWAGPTPCTNGYEDPTGPQTQVGAWVWCRTDNRYPWRMMFIDKSNPYKLPILGDATIINFPTFKPLSPSEAAVSFREVAQPHRPRRAVGRSGSARSGGAWTDSPFTSVLGGADVWETLRATGARADEATRSAAIAQAQALIPGLAPLSGDCKPYSLPKWANTFAMTALTIPTAGLDPFPTEVFYDWANERQATRFYQVDGSRADTILLKSITYDVLWNKNGSHVCQGTEPVGPPVPNWPTADQCQCRAVIKNNPQLSPNKTTVLFVCPSDHGRVFWVWYTSTGVPVMFSEVPQCCDVTLTLMDYMSYQRNPVIDPGVFYVPPDCMKGAQNSGEKADADRRQGAAPKKPARPKQSAATLRARSRSRR